jgi:hypothetical protein
MMRRAVLSFSRNCYSWPFSLSGMTGQGVSGGQPMMAVVTIPRILQLANLEYLGEGGEALCLGTPSHVDPLLITYEAQTIGFLRIPAW